MINSPTGTQKSREVPAVYINIQHEGKVGPGGPSSTERVNLGSWFLLCGVSLGRSGPYLVLLVFVLDFQGLHGSDHGLHGSEDVLVDQLGEASLVLVSVASSMDNPHLFDKRALSTLSRSWENTSRQTIFKTTGQERDLTDESHPSIETLFKWSAEESKYICLL